MEELRKSAVSYFGISSNSETRLWKVVKKTSFISKVDKVITASPNYIPKLIEKTQNSLSENGVRNGTVLFLELRGNNGYWPIDREANRKMIKSSQSRKVKEITAGTIGLSNLGNTCYFNSAIQALSHLPQFAEYFTLETYKKEINRRNKMGIFPLFEVSKYTIPRLTLNLSHALSFHFPSARPI